GSYFPTGGPGSMTWANVFGGGAAGPPPCPTSCPGYRRANQWDLKDPRVFQWSTAFERNVGLTRLTSGPGVKPNPRNNPLLRSRYRTLRFIDLEFELLRNESRDAFHHSLTGSLTTCFVW